jgi:hypothetical protein
MDDAGGEGGDDATCCSAATGLPNICFGVSHSQRHYLNSNLPPSAHHDAKKRKQDRNHDQSPGSSGPTAATAALNVKRSTTLADVQFGCAANGLLQ